jgi:hypothetical protein
MRCVFVLQSAPAAAAAGEPESLFLRGAGAAWRGRVFCLAQALSLYLFLSSHKTLSLHTAFSFLLVQWVGALGRAIVLGGKSAGGQAEEEEDDDYDDEEE